MKLNRITSIIFGAMAIAAVSSQALAAENATVKFNARLVAATCDVTTSKNVVSLGTHSIDKITETTKAIAQDNFNLVLNNCTKIYDDKDEGAPSATDVSIMATGDILAGHNEMFADANTTQIGVKLKSTDTAIMPNEDTVIPNIKITGNSDYIIPINAGLYATTTTDLNVQSLNVPVTFSVAYN